MTKKIIKNANAILSALMLVSLLLAACGGGATPAAAAATVAPAAVVAEATAAATEAPAAVVAEATAAATEAPPAATAVPPTATAPPLDASCAGKGAVIQVHDWSSADRQEYWDQVIKAFNDAYPCIKAQTIKLPEDRAVRLTQLGGGTAPDLVAFDSSDLPLVFRMGYLSDLTPLMTTDKFDPAKQFYEGVYKTGIVDGKLVAVAKDYSVSAFYVNTGLLQKAGIAVPKEGWTYDDYLKMAQKLTVDKKGNNATSLDFDPANVAVYGTSSPQWGGDAAWWRGYQSFLYSWGAHTISPDGKATTGYINSTEAVAAWTWHREWGWHRVAPDLDLVGGNNFPTRPMPDVIGPADGEASSFLHIKSAQRAPKTVDCKSGFISDDLEVFKFRAAVGEFQTIILDEGPAHEAGGDVAFIAWVNVFALAEVDDDRLPSVGQTQRLRLAFA